MTFLNWAMLAALAAVAIPILIHLLNRSRARVVDWGAMRFLEASLASRSRRILLEEVILLTLRCLAVALAVLAVARPFLPTRPTALAVLIGPAVLGAALCAALTAGLWTNRRVRKWLIVATLLLLALPPAAGAIEHAYQKSLWTFGGGEKDVAIVIDGSTSMELSYDGNTNFSRAIAEARAVLASCGRGDGVSLVLAGPAPATVLANPTANGADVEVALRGLHPAGGAMRVVPALQAAAQSLTAGANPAKKIVLITDGQQVGWDVRSEPAWRMLGSSLKQFVAPPQIIIRTLEAPRRFTNAAAADITLDRRVVGTDREVGIYVKVVASGTEPVRGRVVHLLVDGQPAGTQEIAQVLPGAAETVRFAYRFGKPGRHVVAAELAGGDDLPADDAAHRVVDVLRALPVLVVDGTPSAAPLEGSGDFLDIALAPPGGDSEGPAAPLRSPKPPRDANGKPDEEYRSCVVAVRKVAAPDIASAGEVSKYAVVILADVPLLPKAYADSLARFVREGGGLLVTPGPTARADFYNAWTDETGQAMMPGKLVKLCMAADKPVRVLPHTFTHPALEKVADAAQSDAASATVSSYWRIEPPESDRGAAVGGQIETTEPLLLERRCGKGRILLAATAFHKRCTNLPALQCFVPLAHELTYWLAATAVSDCNVDSGADVTIELRPDTPKGKAASPDFGELSRAAGPLLVRGQKLDVAAPFGRRRSAVVTRAEDPARVAFSETQQPGLYRLILPPQAAARYAGMSPDANGVPFVVVDAADETAMAMLSEADLQTARGHLLKALPDAEAGTVLAPVEATNELTAAVAGGVPGRELWRILALLLAAVLAGEIVLTRWIAVQRRAHVTETVSFGAETVDLQAFRRRAREMLAAGPAEPAVEKETVGK